MQHPQQVPGLKRSQESGPYFLHIQRLPPSFKWTDLKDLIRSYAVHGVWADMTLGIRNQPGTGYARVQRRSQALNVYKQLTSRQFDGRRLIIHLWDISDIPARFVVCNCARDAFDGSDFASYVRCLHPITPVHPQQPYLQLQLQPLPLTPTPSPMKAGWQVHTPSSSGSTVMMPFTPIASGNEWTPLVDSPMQDLDWRGAKLEAGAASTLDVEHAQQKEKREGQQGHMKASLGQASGSSLNPAAPAFSPPQPLLPGPSVSESSSPIDRPHIHEGPLIVDGSGLSLLHTHRTQDAVQ